MPTVPTTTLIVLDGFGHRSDPTDNAIAQAATPFLDETYALKAHSLISGSGIDVGLPAGQMGNSEVGHMNLGAGRVVHQDFTRINQAIEDESFFSNPVFINSFDDLAKTGRTLHVLGLLSPGGVHSHEDHLNAVISLAAARGVKAIEIHGFLDGRDVPPKSATASITKVEAHCKDLGIGRIATLVGRYFAMDRDQRWERIKKAFDLIHRGQADHRFETAHAGLEAAYQRGETDEFLAPTVIGSDQTAGQVRQGDQIIFINFRSDRARAISEAFTQENFDKFERPQRPALSRFITFTQYSDTLSVPCAFPPEEIQNGLGEHLAHLGFSQLRIASPFAFRLERSRDAETRGIPATPSRGDDETSSTPTLIPSGLVFFSPAVRPPAEIDVSSASAPPPLAPSRGRPIRRRELFEASAERARGREWRPARERSPRRRVALRRSPAPLAVG